MNQIKISTITNHFRLNHHFFEPYEIILDGNFIKLLVERNQPFQKKLEVILNGKVFTKVTECIIRELEVLGDRFKFVLAEAKKQQIIKCKHLLGVTPKQCIQELIGEDNSKKYMVCSQDIELRRNIRQLPNVPIFYFGPDQRITMEEIQIKHKIQLQKDFKLKLLPKEHQIKPIAAFKQQKKQEQKYLQKKNLLKQVAFQGIQLKKIAKGPNPLANKKKKKKFTHNNRQNPDDSHDPENSEEPNNQQEQLQNAESEIPKKKRIRKKKKKVHNYDEQ